MTLAEHAATPIEAFLDGATRIEGVMPLRRLGVDIDRLGRLGRICVFESPVYIRAQLVGSVRVGAFSYTSSGEISNATIGRYCSIADGVSIGPAEHPTGWLSTHPFQYSGTGRLAGNAWEALRATRGFDRYGRGPMVVGHDTWIGANAVIRRGASLGPGAVVGANAVVSTPVHPYDIVAGAPARRLRSRMPDEALCQQLLRLNWWDWDLSPVSADLGFEDPRASLRQIEAAIAAGSIAPADHPETVTRRDRSGQVWMRHYPREPRPAGSRP